jgi:hypothetical protein
MVREPKPSKPSDAPAKPRKRPKLLTRARTVDSVEWHRRAVELRTQGRTYQQIADELGVSVGGAHVAVTRYLEETRAISREGAEEIRRLELDRLDRILSTIGPQAEGGDLAAVDRVLRLQERRAHLLGLDAPKASSVTVDARPDVVKALMNLAVEVKP